MVTAQRLIDAAQIVPSDLVAPGDDEQAEAAALLARVENDILPMALAEVAVPVFEAAGLNEAQGMAALANSSSFFQSLFDAAVISYGRSEINKQIASDASSIDKDSDQDRIQGNNRLAKLLQAVAGGALGPVFNSSESPRAALLTVSIGSADCTDEYSRCE